MISQWLVNSETSEEQIKNNLAIYELLISDVDYNDLEHT